MFKEFKKYCQLALTLDKYIHYEKAIYSIYREKKDNFFSFCVASIFGFCLIGFPFFAYYLGSNGITGRGWNAINFILSFHSLVLFFICLNIIFMSLVLISNMIKDWTIMNFQTTSFLLFFLFMAMKKIKKKQELFMKK